MWYIEEVGVANEATPRKKIVDKRGLRMTAVATSPETVVDPMGVAGEATPVAAAGTEAPKPPSTRKARKPDPDAPKRKALVKSIFAEATKSNSDKAAAETAAIQRCLEINAKEGKDAVRFKVTDFKDAKGETGAPGARVFFNFRIAWHNARIIEIVALRDGKKSISPEKAKKKVEKINKDLKDLLAQLQCQGVDLKGMFGDTFDAEKLIGMKV